MIPSAKHFVSVLLSLFLFALPLTSAQSEPSPLPTVDLALSFDPALVSNSDSTKPTVVAKTFLTENQDEWGVNATDFQLENKLPGPDGLTTVRFQQFLNDVPVLGSIAAFTLDANLRLLSAVIKTGQEPINSISLDTNTAGVLARNQYAEQNNLAISDVQIVSTKIAIASPGVAPFVVLDNRYVWDVRLTSTSGPMEFLSVLFDDQNQVILYESKLTRDVADISPLVCDFQTYSDDSINDFVLPQVNVSGHLVNYLDMDGLSRLPLCSFDNSGLTSQVGSTTAQGDMDAATAGIEKTISYYRQFLNLEINAEDFLGNISSNLNYGINDIPACALDDERAACQPRITAFTNVCVLSRGADLSSINYPCSFENAFWTPWPSSDCRSSWCSAIYFGRGYAADDVVAHELTHGVTGAIAFQSSLSPQAAALSEAYSDFFGEAVDQANVDANEIGDSRWLIGEDIGYTNYKGFLTSQSNQSGDEIAGIAPGPFRNMKGINQISQITSSYSNSRDEHDNSGPANRFVWLISNGGTQSGITVSPIGTVASNGLCETNMSNCTAIKKMTKLTLLALYGLTSSSSYVDFSKAIRLACDTLRKTTGSGFTATNCVNVNKALDITGISDGVITYQTHPTSVKRNRYKDVYVTAKALTGSPIAGATVKLKVLVSGKWITKATARTDSSGRARFHYKWTQNRTYRVIVSPTVAVPFIAGKTYKLRVN